MADGGVLAAGWAAVQSGRPAEADRIARQALAADPGDAEAWFLLGAACHCQGRAADAADAYACAVRLRPDYPDALLNQGNALKELGRADEAADCYRRTLALRPDDAGAYYNLGITRLDQGRPGDGEMCFRQVVRQQPDDAEAAYHLGLALERQHRSAEAADCYARAVRLRPDYPEAHNNLGNVLRDLNRLAEAESSFRRALALRPDDPSAHNNLGAALRDQARPGEAETHYRHAQALRPEFPAAHNNLGVALRDQGRVDEAADCFRRALELKPDYVEAHDGLLLTLHYRAGIAPAEMAAAHAEYQERHAAPLRAARRPHANDRDPDRRLRVGLVSGDFGRHPAGYLLMRSVEALGRRPVTVVCYSNRAAGDDFTARFRASSSVWRDVASLSDEALTETIRADGIDVLIDLAGHTAGNRLLAFARKPAPVQCSWLGYEGVTGVVAIDYLIADERLVPPGAEAQYRGQVLCLSGGYATYDPPAHAPHPGPPPALASGRVTFGCFNNPAKLSGPALTAFADVLRRVSGSRLVLKYRGLDDAATADHLRSRLAAAGADPGRVDLRGVSAPAEYLAEYREIDIALDPFPFGGGVTTCDALWMGVPVVTLPLGTFASRHGLSYLWSIGLADELAARDADDYAARAAALAHDQDRLAALRAGLRERMARSPLCDGDRLADELLTTIRRAWQVWTATGQ